MDLTTCNSRNWSAALSQYLPCNLITQIDSAVLLWDSIDGGSDDDDDNDYDDNHHHHHCHHHHEIIVLLYLTPALQRVMVTYPLTVKLCLLTTRCLSSTLTPMGLIMTTLWPATPPAYLSCCTAYARRDWCKHIR